MAKWRAAGRDEIVENFQPDGEAAGVGRETSRHRWYN
jgi:hypothetical protein